MFNKLTCKVRFHIVVSLKTFLKTNHFPAKFAREALTKSAVLYQSFSSETGLENSRKNPAKSAVFSANLSLKIPRNLTFFPAIYQKPCQIVTGTETAQLLTEELNIYMYAYQILQ